MVILRIFPFTLLKSIVLRHLNLLKKGYLDIHFPDRTTQQYGDLSAEKISLSIHNPNFYLRTALFGEIGFGESYMLAEWSTPDLTKLLGFLYENLDILEGKYSFVRSFFSRFNNFQHRARQNTTKQSVENIKRHYDLSNEMFSMFLDESMTYSSGIFDTATSTLFEAQMSKINRLIDKLQLTDQHHLLEIGCGWGSLAIQAAKRTGCRVTGITLSEEQYNYAIAAVNAAGLSNKIDIMICDYRNLPGEYDRIVSVEMIEAVGHQFLPTYFKTLNRLLKTGGIAALQAITIPDHRYVAYSSEADWIQKHIFPGGHLPSMGEINRLVLACTDLNIETLENIGPHYATTLRVWRERFLSRKSDIYKLGFTSEFIRKWEFYFSYCEAGFEKRYLSTYQISLTKSEPSR